METTSIVSSNSKLGAGKMADTNKHNRTGRPELPTGAKRRRTVALRLTDAEYAELKREADEKRIGLAVWLRLKTFSNEATASA